MQFITSKQVYPVVLGITVGVLALGVWQKKINLQTEIVKPEVNPVPTSESKSKPLVAKPLPPKASGPLSVSNLSIHPVRVVLQSRSAAEPFNWDFSPGEGQEQGLQLSLSQVPLVIDKGDILFIFAIDGSRTYWGPWIVGESSSLVWQGDRRGWSLAIK